MLLTRYSPSRPQKLRFMRWWFKLHPKYITHTRCFSISLCVFLSLLAFVSYHSLIRSLFLYLQGHCWIWHLLIKYLVSFNLFSRCFLIGAKHPKFWLHMWKSSKIISLWSKHTVTVCGALQLFNPTRVTKLMKRNSFAQVVWPQVPNYMISSLWSHMAFCENFIFWAFVASIWNIKIWDTSTASY